MVVLPHDMPGIAGRASRRMKLSMGGVELYEGDTWGEVGAGDGSHISVLFDREPVDLSGEPKVSRCEVSCVVWGRLSG